MKKYSSLILLLVTNTLTAFIFSIPDEVIVRESKSPALKKGFMRFNLPGKIFFPLIETNASVPVSIFNKKGELLIKKAFLFKTKTYSSEENQAFDFGPEEKSPNNFTIDISIDESKKIVKLSTNFVHFFPFDKRNQFNKIKRQNYEIKF